MHIMTNKNFNLLSAILEMHRTDVIWDISSSYYFCCQKGYTKSKRSFERELMEINFSPKSFLDNNDESIKKLVFKTWEGIASSKRILSLKSSRLKFNGENFLFYKDKRGKKYWHGISNLTSLDIVNSSKKISAYTNQTIIFWPSSDLLDKYSLIVKEYGTEKLSTSNSHQIIFPVSSFQRILTEDDLMQKNDYNIPVKINEKSLTHLEKIESEAIHIIRETIAEAENPVMLYSVGKDSAVMLHLAKKAFYPASPPFPLMHVDTGWKFNEMYQFRDIMAKDAGMDLIIHKNKEGLKKNINPFDHGSDIHTDIMKTQSLKQALDKYKFDFALGGARRDEEKSRAKERILSFRSENHAWDPKNQRPELWDLYNFNKKKNESARVFPISNWTELDVWQYIYKESIPIVPLYYAAERPFVERDNTLLFIDDDRFQIMEGEKISFTKARFRTLGCYPLTGAVESNSSDITQVLLELIESNSTEREGRLIDSDSEGSMEKKKKEGYF